MGAGQVTDRLALGDTALLMEMRHGWRRGSNNYLLRVGIGPPATDRPSLSNRRCIL